LALILSDRGRWIEQAIDSASVHQVSAHEAGEGEQTLDGCLRCIGEAQQQKRDEGDGDLDADGIFGHAEEVLDLQGLLDPAKEQLDTPYMLPLII